MRDNTATNESICLKSERSIISKKQNIVLSLTTCKTKINSKFYISNGFRIPDWLLNPLMNYTNYWNTYLYYKVLVIFSFEHSELPAYPVPLGRECFSLPLSCPKIAGLMIKMIIFIFFRNLL